MTINATAQTASPNPPDPNAMRKLWLAAGIALLSLGVARCESELDELRDRLDAIDAATAGTDHDTAGDDTAGGDTGGSASDSASKPEVSSG